MGNCSGFCMSSNSEEQQPKKVTADKVQRALVEKDKLFKESATYENQFDNVGQNKGAMMQARKLQNNSSNNNENNYEGDTLKG